MLQSYYNELQMRKFEQGFKQNNWIDSIDKIISWIS